MPNGFHGSNHDWDRMESPLLKIDAMLTSFAILHGRTRSANYHSETHTDLLGGRKEEKRQFLRKAVPLHELEGDLSQLLLDAKEMLNTWSSCDLEVATTLKGIDSRSPYA